MATFSANLNSSGSLKLYLDLNLISQDQVNNKSKVQAKAYISGNGGGAWSNYSTSGYLIINGARYDFSLASYNFGSSAYVLLKDITVDIYHDSSGNATANASVYYNPNNSAWLNAATASGSLPLTQIGRADSLAIEDITAGQSTNIPITITQKRGLASRYVVRVAVGGVSYDKEIADASQYSYNVELTQAEWNKLYESANNTNYPTFAVILYTYNGASLVGSDIKYATLTIPDAPPTIGSVSAVETVSAISNIISGSFLQNASGIRIVANSVIAYYQARITEYEITVKNPSGAVLETFNTSSATFTPTVSGQLQIVVRVKDSRGKYSSPKVIYINVIPYQKPQITRYDVFRSDASGTLNVAGTYINNRMTASVSSVVIGGSEKNSLRYKIDDITNGTINKVPLTNAYALSINNGRVLSNYALEQNYKLKFTASDAFGQYSYIVVNVGISLVTMTKGKYGIAVGGIYDKYDTEGVGFQAWNTARFKENATFDKKVNGGEIATLVQKVGHEMNGYERWSNGKLVCFKILELSEVQFPNALVNTWYSNKIYPGAWPSSFIDGNIATSFTVLSTGVGLTVEMAGDGHSAGSVGPIFICRNGTNGSVSGVKIYIRAEGRWK